MNKTWHKNYNLLDYIFIFILIIYAGSATSFVRAISTWENLIGLLLPIVFAIGFGFYHRINISKKFLYLISGYIIYNLMLTIKFDTIHPRFFGIYLISFVISYITFSALRFRFFIVYEKLIVTLSIIALVFWIFHILAPNALIFFMNQIAFSTPGSANVDSNIIFYTVNNLSEISNFGLLGLSLVRNSGFAWEPGAFACFIDLAIFVNLIKTKFRLVNNINLWILTIALISTFSTTGFTIYMLLIIFYTYNQKFKYSIVVVPVILIFIIYISTLPFMAEKIIDASGYDTEEMIENSITYETKSTPQRIESLEIDFVDFLNNPILGYGGHMEEQWTAKLGAQVATISGIGKVMAVFGLVGLLFFSYSLFKTSVEITKLFRFRGWLFPFIIIVMISVSYSLIFMPLLMCFWLMNDKYLAKMQKFSYLIEKYKIARSTKRIY